MKLHKTSPTFVSISIIIVAVFNSCMKEERPVDMIKNGNVENGLSVPTNWFSSTGMGKYATTWSDQESSSPDRSLKISTSISEPTDFAYWGQTISTDLPTGKALTLTAKIKSKLKGQGVSLVIRGDNANQQTQQFITTQGISAISGTFDWTNYSVKLDNVDTKTQSIVIYLVYLQNTTGEVYFDDISLTF